MKNLYREQFKGLSRRNFIAGCCGTAVLSSCAVNPVTGENQLMFVSKQEELAMDKQRKPYQYSNDYGVLQNASINQYISNIGHKIAKISHRPDMAYNFQGVNANYVNAYAFPGGSIAITRSMLVRMESEAELAALLGHEVGHVTARHTASRMSKGSAIGGVLSIGSILLQGAGYGGYAQPVQQLAGIGAQALLANYSRDDERQSDELGMEYMVKAGYSPQGMVDLTDLLLSLNKGSSAAAQSIFASHPMSSERNATAKQQLAAKYSQYTRYPMSRERYMDTLSPLMRIKPAILAFGDASMALAQENFVQAEQLAQKGLSLAPNDYAGLLILAKTELSQEKWSNANAHIMQAQIVYPEEAQSYYLGGMSALQLKQSSQAIQQFNQYEQKLPGNPYIAFYSGYAYELDSQQKPAAENYYKFLQAVQQGEQAEYAYNKLLQWGYIKK